MNPPQELARVANGEQKPETKPGGLDACWQRIGVYGNGQCGELSKFVHCRNCPVYSAAAQELLDRPVPTEYRREWTLHYAEKQNGARPVRSSAVLFRTQSEWLALPADVFQEVAERRPIHSLPHRRLGIVLGLVNIRGELLICAALNRVLGLETVQPNRKSTDRSQRLLVANFKGSRFVFPVDEVHGIHRFLAGELRDVPATVSKAAQSYTQGIFFWRGKSVGLLEAPPLFVALNRSLA